MRSVPYIILLMVIVSFEAIAIKPLWIFFVAPILFLFILALLRRGNQWIKKITATEKLELERQVFWSLSAFLFSGLLFFFFIQSAVLRQLFIFFIALTLFMLAKKLLLPRPDEPAEKSDGFPLEIELKNIPPYLNLLTAFFFSSFLFSLNVFLSLPVWLLILVAVAANLGLCLQIFKINKVPSDKIRPYSMVTVLVLSETCLAVAFLPFSFYVRGLILTMAYYLTAGIFSSSAVLKGPSIRQSVWSRLLVGGAALGIIFLTARWY